MQAKYVSSPVETMNDALSIIQANEADLALGKVSPEELLEREYA